MAKIDPTCPSDSGSNSTSNQPLPYVPKDFCIGTVDYAIEDDTYQEQYAIENLNMGGARVNVFKLLGVHEQGLLVDLVGYGEALNNSYSAFDDLSVNYISSEEGMDVLTTPSWIGYDFGVVKTSFNQNENAPGQPNTQHITSIKINQPTDNKRALQIRIDRSVGDFELGTSNVSGTGNGSLTSFQPGQEQKPGLFVVEATSSTSFNVYFTTISTILLGVATLNVLFASIYGCIKVVGGATPFVNGDMITAEVKTKWLRVDVVNLPNVNTDVLVRIKQSSPSRYWRIVPLSFSGVMTNDSWEVKKVQLYDYQATTLDDIQDQFFLENRDRDYANTSVELRAIYQPIDAISDLSKFGFQLNDSFAFSTTFSSMVKALGRPLVVGDIIEVPSELQYDQNLKPVKKFLEISDTGWSASGYTTSWRPIIFKFQAENLVPSQENRDILGTIDTEKYFVDDGSFFDGVKQIQTGQLTSTENIQEEARKAVPETGTNVREVASGTNVFKSPGSYDGIDLYKEDGLPPDGQPYTEGFRMPDVGGVTDGAFFRLNYPPLTNIPSRLYRFNGVKNYWEYVETDRRRDRTSFRQSQDLIFKSPQVISPNSKGL